VAIKVLPATLADDRHYSQRMEQEARAIARLQHPHVCALYDVERFRSCRSFANYLGLTPREFSSGEKRRLGHISRQGNDYLRTLLVHGARSILRIAPRHPNDPLCRWAVKLRLRAPHNKAAVGVANKLARIAWAVWKHERLYKSEPLINT